MREMLVLLMAFFSLLLSTCSLSPVSGTGSGGEARTASVTGTALYDGGKPAVDARVVLRPETYLSGITEYDQPDHEVLTDSNGLFTIDSVDTGSYCLEINDGKSYALLLRFRKNSADSLIALAPDTLKKTGSLRGVVSFSLLDSGQERILLQGIERPAEEPSPSGAFVIENIPQSRYSVVVIPAIPGFASDTIEDVPVPSGAEYDMGTVKLRPTVAWVHSQKIVLNTSSTGADVSGNVHDFPVLVRLNVNNFMFEQTMSDGADIRFAKSDSTLLPFEIERWDSVAGVAEVWVRIDTLYGNDSTQHILMFWGDSTGNLLSFEADGAVFDTAAGFRGVWHLGGSADSLIPDATQYGYHGTPYSMEGTAIQGAIGLARQFDGESSYISMEGTQDGGLNFPVNGTYSISAWVNTDILNERYRIIASKGNKQYNLQLKNNDNWEFTEFQDTPSDSVGWEETLGPAETGMWTHLVGIRSGTRQYLYINGACVDSTIDLFPLKADDTLRQRDETRNFAIGRLPDGPSYFFRGGIDEVRVSGTELSGDWIKLSYMNQREDDRLVVIKQQ